MPDDPCRDLWQTTFLKVKATQYWSDFLVWERILNRHDELQAIIELGSGTGGFSLYLLLQCLQRGMRFYTLDRTLPSVLDTNLARSLGLIDRFFQVDLWQEGEKLIKMLLARFGHPILLFCDNGDKPREFTTFMPLLMPGDLIAVHDWGNEFTKADISPEQETMIERVMAEETRAIGTLTVFYKRL